MNHRHSQTSGTGTRTRASTHRRGHPRYSKRVVRRVRPSHHTKRSNASPSPNRGTSTAGRLDREFVETLLRVVADLTRVVTAELVALLTRAFLRLLFGANDVTRP